jgi:hypothetical protein
VDVGDLIALRQLVDIYADAVDRGDGPALAALFTPDGFLQARGQEWRGPRVADSLEVLEVFDRTFHHVGGAVFESDGDGDGAAGRVHCLAHHHQHTDSGPVDLVMMIRYHDRYASVEGKWLFAERRVVIEWTETHPAHRVR